jgi:hypothetical protein
MKPHALAVTEAAAASNLKKEGDQETKVAFPIKATHSVRRAVVGSTVAARRAGTAAATSATTAINSTTAASVNGSAGDTPNN